MLPVLRLTTIAGRQVGLVYPSRLDQSVARSFAFGCTRDYLLTGEVEEEVQLEDVKILALRYDRKVYLYQQLDNSVEVFNLEGHGCLVLHRDLNEITSLVVESHASYGHGDYQTQFSIYSPLIRAIEKSSLAD